MKTLKKIKALIQEKFGIPTRNFMDNESFVIIGISSKQMEYFLVDIEVNFAIRIDVHGVNFFDIDTPLKLAHLVDKLAV